ncbi:MULTISPECIES: hypothetical protein [Streptomyces]|uniref:hypothetical protein n=1 Tax=Streptomyces TaxID=1883 RepID=UPI000562B135|nr:MULTISPECIES: hypothetical protein [Streptomyces]AKL68849.1 hypothetical protein M444_29320 [Streptomyces sp. Mg1]RPK35008.1 hypothetical protein EES37_29420 [Streptomyces sp. ADI91-18]WBY23119.1 hypothetical protein PET44_27835 [Streptomyces goshikiensis]WSS01943.1 hypothetical protein OG224_30010 [Streptomyces goshikiensis]WSX96770.1 hypothetical protein OG590_05680 [Streptomyces goshikiensis]
MKRSTRTAVLTVGALIAALGLPTAAAHADTTTPRVDLRVLVVTDGGPAVQAITAELDSTGTPYTQVDLTRSDRPTINPAFLADTVDGRPRAKYQAVVLPNDNPFTAGSAEMTALTAYEQTYAIPQVDAYTYARPQVGLQYFVAGGYAGSVDGAQAAITTAGRSGPFGYLEGAVPFEDNSPSVGESYAYLAQPAPGADFTPYVDAPIPGSSRRGSLVGEYRHDGRRELVVTFVYNRYQQQYRLLARGIVEWMTGGVHLGSTRNNFSVHVDDVFAADDRWDTQLNCTPGDVDCANGAGTPNPIRMTAADAEYAKTWQAAHGITLDMVYNGAGSLDQREDHNGVDELADKLQADRSAFRWVNHTYTHAFLGCEQDISAVPWKCATNPGGSTKWVSRTAIDDEIVLNRVWGQSLGLPLENDELVTGEHSGMAVLPQQTQDNPNLALSLTGNGVKWLASDNSRDPEQRQVGSAATVARYPMNVYYNVGKAAEAVDEYNWIYTSRAQGGSGICEDHADTTTCLPAPLATATGYADHIVPLEIRTALGHVLAGDPKPHFIHQSNLAEERLAYPVLNGVIEGYDALFAANTPLVNQRMKDIGTELQRRAAWKSALQAGQVSAYRIGDSVTVTAPSGVAVTATLPTGSRTGAAAYGSPYAGKVSGWTGSTGTPLTFTLPSSAPAAPTAAVPAARPAPATAPAPGTRVPAAVRERGSSDAARS